MVQKGWLKLSQVPFIQDFSYLGMPSAGRLLELGRQRVCDACQKSPWLSAQPSAWPQFSFLWGWLGCLLGETFTSCLLSCVPGVGM